MEENKIIVEHETPKQSVNLKKWIKIGTLVVGVILIVFTSFFNTRFDLENINWYDWLTNSILLLAIMLYGIFMGQSTGEDYQKNKVGGLFQKNCNTYNETLLLIDSIKIYFSQWWLWFKEKQLKEKQIDYLIDHRIDGRIASVIVNNIKSEDVVVGKLIYDNEKPTEKIYVKEGSKGRAIKIKKITEEEGEIVKKIFQITLDTYSDSYYLTLYDDGDTKVNMSEKGKKINDKIKRDKIVNYAIKISTSFILSIVWSALTINDFVSDETTQRQAWFNLMSRLFALITSLFSGFGTAVVNVRDQARAIENKSDVLNEFHTTTEKGLFVPETYEEMIEREYKEQELEQEKVEEHNE